MSSLSTNSSRLDLLELSEDSDHLWTNYIIFK